MTLTTPQYQLLQSIIDKELNEIEEEMVTQDNTDISSVIAFHIEHGIRDVEQRIAEGETTELEVPHDASSELVQSMNNMLLTLEALLQYYYRACYFGTEQQRNNYRFKIKALLDSEQMS